jgi:hypothetical protein
MNTTKRSDTRRTLHRWGLLLACVSISIGISPSSNGIAAQAPQQRTFSSAEDAAKTLVEVVKKGNVDDMLAIFGKDGQDLLDTADPATARMNRQVFVVAAAEQWHLTDDGKGGKTLVIGNEDWPFPVPIVKAANGWRFDTAAGKEEVIARRIGRNELAALDSVRAYVSAQRRYAEQGHDGIPAGTYATKFRSDPGKQNGLYWPTKRGEKLSPLGDLVAQAEDEGRAITPDRSGFSPFHGYYFKILGAQGGAATGGAKSYLVKGQMSGGFALVAWPAEYDVTGVMTFIVNQDGVVREKDLGAETDALARKMANYNPDASWRVSQ